MVKILWLLLWKNYLTVRGAWGLFCVCFLCEIAWFSLIHRHLWKEYKKVSHPTIPLKLESIEERPIHIYYSPSTNFTDTIINGVTKDVRDDVVQIHPFQSFHKMFFEIYNQAISGYVVGINFTHPENVSDGLPKTLFYEIWEVFNVNSTFHLSRRTAKQRDELSNCQRMICVQGAIDKSFIDQVVKDNNYTFFGTSVPISFSDRCLSNFKDDVGSILIQRNAALSLISLLIVLRVSRERAAGGQRLMMVAGMPSWSNWSSWLITSFVIELIPCLVISIIIYLLYFSSNLNPILVYLLITMYCLASKCSYFFIISIINHQDLSRLLCFALWLVSQLPLLCPREDFKFKILTSFLPQMAVVWGYGEIEEMKGTMCSGKVRVDENWSLNAAIGFLAIDCFIYISLAWITDVLFNSTFWREFPIGQQKQPKKLPFQSIDASKSERTTFEPSVTGEPVSIAVRDLTYRYLSWKWGDASSNLILTGISMDIRKDEVTFILGPNEREMSTFLSAITGNLNPTSGSVTVDGLNPRYIWKIGLDIGICLHNSLFFSALSPKENLMFFSMFRGYSIKTASIEADMIMKMLNIKNTSDKHSEAMYKKMCIGMALIGTPPILVLDEPTVGLGADARKDVWKVINSIRYKHTIIITTMNSNEADNMADRIAIVHQGCIQAYGTNIWLKRHFGPGYNLSLNTHNGNNTEVISQEVQRFVPEAKIIKSYDVLLTYNIPYERREEVIAIINAFGQKETELGILNIYIDLSSLEEIYKNICFLPTYSLNNDFSSYTTIVYKPSEKHEIIRNQLTALMKKKLLYTYRFSVKWKYFGLMTFLAHAGGFIIFGNEILNFDKNEFSMQNYTDIRGCYYIEGNVSLSLVESYKNALAKVTHTFKQAFRFIDLMDMPISATIIEDHGKLEMNALYGPWVGDICWKSVNTMTNAVLHSVDPQLGIIMQKMVFDIYLIHNRILDAVFFSCLGFVLILAYFPLVPMEERLKKTKLMQSLAGITNLMYWSVYFFIDLILYMIFSCAVVFAINFVNENLVVNDLLAVLMLFFIFGICAIPVTYLHTLIFNSYVQVITCISFQYTICIVIHLSLIEYENFTIMKILNFYPVFGLISAVLHLYMQMSENICVRIRTEIDCSRSHHYCCSYPCADNNCFNIKPYLAFSSTKNPHGIGDKLLSFGIGTILVTVLLLMIDSKFLQRSIHKMLLKVSIKENHEILQEDSEVSAEKEFAHILSSEIYSSEYLLAVDSLTKKYRKGNYSVKYFSVVDSASLVIKKGDFFGLLGCNDAGKTLLVKMIVGDEFPSSGKVRLFCKSIGYCPQDVQLFPSLTGYENLSFFAIIRGLPRNRQFCEVEYFLKYFGLWENKNMFVYQYSKTERRKLGIAVAMIGNPDIVIMDTSTTGVDPITRPQLWKAVQKLQKPWQGIIVTSHFLQEREETYTKFASMINGRFLYIGNGKQLQDKYDLGVSLRIYTKMSLSNKIPHNLLMEAIERKFENNLKLKLRKKYQLLYIVVDRAVKVTILVNGVVELQKEFAEVEEFSIEKSNICCI